MKRILGIRYGHDAAACLVVDGRIIVDAAEERFTRRKNDGSFPINAIQFCLDFAGVKSTDLDAIAVPSKGTPEPFRYFFNLPDEPKKPQTRSVARIAWRALRGGNPAPKPVGPVNPLPHYLKPWPLSPGRRIINVEHHLAHAASAYFTSGLNGEKALTVVMDGVGDNTSVSLWRGQGNRLEKLKHWDERSSIGWFYAAATEGIGWRQSSEEWKTMGLAPYGATRPGALKGFYPEFKDGELIRPHDFGEPMRFPDHGSNHYHLRDATALGKIAQELGRENFAAEVQRVSEEQAMELILPWLQKESVRNLCCAGGFFLNVKVNGKLWMTGKLDRQWIYPNPGDAGLAAGAALYVYFSDNPKAPQEELRTLYLGPSFTGDEIQAILDDRGLYYERPDDLAGSVAALLAENRIIGWFQGRMESGPRALGSRSILMSPLIAENKDKINACVKFREAFRPFCPSMLAEKMDDYLLGGREERFMVSAFDAHPEKAERIPAVVHVDKTLRPQTVHRQDNPRYYDLIKAFGEITGEYVLLNTSFNVKGEPIVCTPSEAIKCFFDTGLEVLVLGDFMIKKPALM